MLKNQTQKKKGMEELKNKEDIQVEKKSKMTEVRPFSLGPDILNSSTKRQI